MLWSVNDMLVFKGDFFEKGIIFLFRDLGLFYVWLCIILIYFLFYLKLLYGLFYVLYVWKYWVKNRFGG